jgi:hypothetical protein
MGFIKYSEGKIGRVIKGDEEEKVRRIKRMIDGKCYECEGELMINAVCSQCGLDHALSSEGVINDDSKTG